jgi:hypothetical protein
MADLSKADDAWRNEKYVEAISHTGEAFADINEAIGAAKTFAIDLPSYTIEGSNLLGQRLQLLRSYVAAKTAIDSLRAKQADASSGDSTSQPLTAAPIKGGVIPSPGTNPNTSPVMAPPPNSPDALPAPPGGNAGTDSTQTDGTQSGAAHSAGSSQNQPEPDIIRAIDQSTATSGTDDGQPSPTATFGSNNGQPTPTAVPGSSGQAASTTDSGSNGQPTSTVASGTSGPSTDTRDSGSSDGQPTSTVASGTSGQAALTTDSDSNGQPTSTAASGHSGRPTETMDSGSGDSQLTSTSVSGGSGATSSTTDSSPSGQPASTAASGNSGQSTLIDPSVQPTSAANGQPSDQGDTLTKALNQITKQESDPSYTNDQLIRPLSAISSGGGSAAASLGQTGSTDSTEPGDDLTTAPAALQPAGGDSTTPHSQAVPSSPFSEVDKLVLPDGAPLTSTTSGSEPKPNDGTSLPWLPPNTYTCGWGPCTLSEWTQQPQGFFPDSLFPDSSSPPLFFGPALDVPPPDPLAEQTDSSTTADGQPSLSEGPSPPEGGNSSLSDIVQQARQKMASLLADHDQLETTSADYDERILGFASGANALAKRLPQFDTGAMVNTNAAMVNTYPNQDGSQTAGSKGWRILQTLSQVLMALGSQSPHGPQPQTLVYRGLVAKPFPAYHPSYWPTPKPCPPSSGPLGCAFYNAFVVPSQQAERAYSDAVQNAISH